MGFREQKESAIKEMSAYKRTDVDLSGLIALRKKYGVKAFSDFPESTKAVYFKIAECFPGAKVYACGSRVRGDYFQPGHPESFEQFVARSAAGMKDKGASDFDFWVEPSAKQSGELPPGADRARLRVPESEKIAIPIWEPKQ